MDYVKEFENKVRKSLGELEWSCPACGDTWYDDRDYTCEVCWCVGGEGTLKVGEYFELDFKRKN